MSTFWCLNNQNETIFVQDIKNHTPSDDMKEKMGHFKTFTGKVTHESL